MPTSWHSVPKSNVTFATETPSLANASYRDFNLSINLCHLPHKHCVLEIVFKVPVSPLEYKDLEAQIIVSSVPGVKA